MNNLKDKYRDLKVNGYEWFGYEGNIHFFQKQNDDKTWSVINCKEEMIHNGDLDWMTKNGYTYVG